MAGRRLIVALAALLLIGGGAILLRIATSDADDRVASLDTLRDESVIFLEARHAFLVYNGGDPLALSDDPQHLGGEYVQWCEESQLFETSTHGEKFDARGYYFSGPAERGLDRFPVRVDDNDVYVDFDHPIQGPEREEGPPIQPQGSFCN